MTTLAKRRPKRQQKREVSAPTLGPYVCAWIERHLVHGEGDYYGQPFLLRLSQKRFIWNAYELERDGSRRYTRVLLGLPKGNGKTEIAAALSCVELAGPVVFDGWAADGSPRAKRRLSPDIPIAAASFEQADLLFGAARIMVSEGNLADFFEPYDTEILLKDDPGQIYRVAAVAGTNDGRRPTFFLADEVHEWLGKKERVHLVLSNGRAKRADAWELSISTAGWDMSSLLGRMYQHGKDLEAGRLDDPRFLFEWHEPSNLEVDLRDIEALEVAIREANPAADDFVSVETLLERALEMPEYEFRRYHLNQWTAAPDSWLPDGAWDGCAGAAEPPLDGMQIVMGFDGSYSGDSTAIVGATVEDNPHLFVVGAWEKPEEGGDGWRVDIPDVEETIRKACARWRVRWVGCDPYRWQRTMAVLNEQGFPILEWPSHVPSRMVPACATFYDMVIDKGLTHDGDPRLARHLDHCIVKIDSRGPRITKDHKDSVRRIDLAVCAVIAIDLVVRARNASGWKVIE